MDSDWLGGLVDRYAAALESVCAAVVRCAGRRGAGGVSQAGRSASAARSTGRMALPRGQEWGTERRGWRPGGAGGTRPRPPARRRAGFRRIRQRRVPSRWTPRPPRRCCESLPLEQREVIVAHLWGGLTFEQIGELSGCSASTAHRQYTAGLSAIRERLGVTCRKSRPIQN